jgi:Secretion system C-terminal sorting domain/SprB repeat
VVEFLRGIPALMSIMVLTFSVTLFANHVMAACPIDLIPTIQHINCYGDPTGGRIAITPTGGITPYKYAWNTGSTSSSLTGLTAGVYAVTVTDSTGCNAVGRYEIKQPNPLEAQIVSNRVQCDAPNSGTAQVVVTGGVSPYKYIWNTGDITPSIGNRLAGIYAVTVTDANGCSISKSITIQEPVFHYSIGSVSIRCTDLSATRRIYIPIRLEEFQTRGIIGLDLQMLNIAGLRLDTIIIDTNLVSSVGYFKDISRTKTTVSILSKSQTLLRTIIRDTGRLMWLGFYVEPNFVPNTVHDLTLSIRESYDYGVKDMCLKVARVSIYDDPFAVVKLMHYDDIPLSVGRVPTSISTYDRVGTLIGTYSPDSRGYVPFNKSNAVWVSADRRIADTTPVLPVINGEDVNQGFKLIAGSATYRRAIDYIFALLAADVNGDGKVTAGDLYLINMRAVLNLKHCKWGRRGVDKDWIAITDEMLQRFRLLVFDNNNLPDIDREDGFMPLRFAAPSILCQKDSMTTHWILLGDVNGNWGLQDIGLRSQSYAQLDICNAEKMPDGRLKVRMTIKNIDVLTSVYWDFPIKMRSIQPQLVSLKENHNFENTSLVSAYIADAQGTRIDDTTTVAYLIFDKQDLKQSDFDNVKIWINGKTASLRTVFQNECDNGGNLNINLFPNPTQDGYFAVKMTVPSLENVKFELVNIWGQVVETRAFQPLTKQFQYDFDISDKPDTFYFLRVTQGKENVTLKISWVR